MDPVKIVRDYLLNNIGHLTRPGTPLLDAASNEWVVPVFCRTATGDVRVGDVTIDEDGRIARAPSREEVLETLRCEESRRSAVA